MQASGPPFLRQIVGAVRAFQRMLVGRWPTREDPVMPASSGDLQRFADGEWEGTTCAVDAQTWRDLDLDALAEQASEGLSVLGQHATYRAIKGGDAQPMKASDAAQPLPELIAAALRQPSPSTPISAAFSRLRTLSFDPTMALFCDEMPALPDWARHLRWFGILLSAAVTVAFAVPAMWIAVLALGVFSGLVQIRLHGALQHWKRCRDAVMLVLRASIDVEVGQSEPAWATRRILRSLAPPWWLRSSQVAEPLNMLALAEYASMPSTLSAFRQHIAAMREIYLALARREAAEGIARLIRRSGAHCRPELVDDPRAMAFRDFKSPLMPGMSAIPEFALKGAGVFLTGQNGVGKSTVLRSLGVNLIAARAFGHCFAESALVPRGRVMTSFRIEDSPQQGHSLYVAELRRARELLDATKSDWQSAVLIDEIFRGTNHLDAVSVAGTVLEELSRQAAVVVSSHNVVLAPLLRDRLTALRVVRAGSNVSIEAGVLVETNGITLMREHGFSRAQVARATVILEKLVEDLAG